MTATQARVVATGRLVRLREKTVEDATRDYQWRSDPELASYDAARPLRISFRSFVATMAEELRHPQPHRHTFAIEDVEHGVHIGNVMYYGYDRRHQDAELGITIGDRAYWSHGYGTDAVRTLAHHAFEELGMRRLYLHTLTWNHRAQRCFERAGFRRIRTVHRSGHEFYYMELTPEDLAAAEAGEQPREAPQVHDLE